MTSLTDRVKARLHQFQFVNWFPEWKGMGYHSWAHLRLGTHINYSILIGWFEIRVWHPGERP